tara:strand:- start:12171 stop:12527 length:357 start_codon:yes stop_codon:yes gene_type:complete
MIKKLISLSTFLEELNDLLNYSEKVYSSYIKNKKKFVYAKILFDVNDEIYNLIKLNITICPKEFHQDAYDLIFHLDVWRAIWLDEVSLKNPRWNEEFAFSNEVTFPKKSVEHLLSLRS